MNVVINPKGEKLLSELLFEKNIYVNSPCGGNGKCGKCKVKILRGATDPAPDENGFVKACITIPLTECEIYVLEEIRENREGKERRKN